MKFNPHKLAMEPFYKDFPDQSLLDDAGYFEDSNQWNINYRVHTDIPCTPTKFLSHNEAQGRLDAGTKPRCILLSTGAHCPMHLGHIDMMEAAKEELTRNGYNVLGGYLSPGHDEYIKQKTGDQWIPIGERIQYATSLIRDHRWLAIDPWEGVFAPGAVNFTTVAYRLRQYINKWYQDPEGITIFMVWGADNARFAQAFMFHKGKDKYGTVIVGRPGYDDRIGIYGHLKNVYVTEGTNSMSSTEIRKNGFKHTLADQVQLRVSTVKSDEVDDVYYDIIKRDTEVINALNKSFTAVWLNESANTYNLSNFVPIQNILDKCVSLDEYCDHPYKLNISRIYDAFGQYKLGYNNRPGTPPLHKQTAAIAAELTEVYLYDDDIFTGRTMDMVESLFNVTHPKVKVLGRLSITSGNSAMEVLDARDFFALDQNNNPSGLVVSYKNKNCRVPYIYPFVCPTTRASIKNPLDFSIEMWTIQKKYYDAETVMPEFYTMFGFEPGTTMQEVCEHYIQFLTEVKEHY